MKIKDINGSEREAQKVFMDPDYPGYVRLEFRRHHEWMTIKEFMHFNPDMGEIVRGAYQPPEDLTGEVSKATNNSLTDTSQNFKLNEYMGFHIWISRGIGEGQVRSVIKNDENTITIDKPWEAKPAEGSQYVLAQEIDENMKAMGNTLPLEDMKKLEEKAIKMDLKNGLKPAERQYTKKN